LRASVTRSISSSITNERMHRIVFLLFLICCVTAQAKEVKFCYYYDCATHASVAFSEQRLANVATLLKGVPESASECEAITHEAGILPRFAEEQIRIDPSEDRDSDVDSRMDSTDQSFAATTYLKVLEGRGLLKIHRVKSRVVHGAAKPRWGTRISGICTDQVVAADSRYFPNGHHAVILLLGAWLKGVKPNA